MNLTAPPRLLLVHAHPDDESLCTGGTIARYAAQGVRVTLVTCTLGEEGEIIPENLRGLASDAADQLGGYRMGELRSACAALGVTDHRYLGGVGRWRDSGMVDTPANAHPRAFAAGDLDEQVAALAEVVRQVRPQVVITYGPDGGYGHPDHIRAHRVTMAAVLAERDSGVRRVFHTVSAESAVRAGLVELAGADGLPYPVPAADDLPWVPDGEITGGVDIADHRDAKLRAIAAHATQVQVWRGDTGVAAFALTNGIAQPVPETEYFVLAHGDGPAATDLFDGLHGGPADSAG